MASLECERCGKGFKYPYLLRRHQERKTPCALIVEKHELSLKEQSKPHSCKFCSHRFTTPQALSRHIKKTCKVAGSKEGMEKLYEHVVQRHNSEIADQAAQIAELKTQVQALMKSSISTNSIGTVNNVGRDQNINNFTINVFGSENVGYLGRPQIKAVLDQALSTSSDPWTAAKLALTQIGYQVYSNPEHPENMTCYLPNKKRDEAMVHMGDTWMIRPCAEITPVMYSRSMDIMFQQQPFEDAPKYGDLMLEARDREKDPAFAREIKQNYRAILVENKTKMAD